MTCVVVLESVFLQILAAVVSMVIECSYHVVYFDNVS